MDKRRFFDFDLDFLTELSSDPQSLVSVHHSDYHFALHPWHLNNFNQSVKSTLYERISKYMSKLDGILLGYKNLRLMSEVGKIHADSYFIHYDVEADFFVFKPEVDTCLNGTVIKKSNDHISCKVYNCFTISVSKQNEEIWIGHDIDVGDIVKMKIEYINYEVPSIKAIILNKEQSGSKVNSILTFEDTDYDVNSSVTKKKSKKKKKLPVIGNEDVDTEANDSESTVLITAFKNTKKQKIKQKDKRKQNTHLENKQLIESVSPSDGITGSVENEFDPSIFVTTATVSQPKRQISSSENESISPQKRVIHKRKEKKERLSSLLKIEHGINNKQLTESVSSSNGIAGYVKNKIDSPISVTTVSQPKMQFNSSENESVSPHRHKRKGKKDQLSSLLMNEHKINNKHLIESVPPSDDIAGSVENRIDSSVFVTTVSQPKIQISSSENESVSPHKHVIHKKKGKKEQLSSLLNNELEINNSFNILKIKTEKDMDLKEKKRKIKDTSLDESNNESAQIARPKKKRKRSSMSLEATKDRLLESILKEKIQEMSTDYSNVQLKHEEIMLPDLDMKDILESINSKNNMTQKSERSFQNGSFGMSDSSLERLMISPVKREPGVPQRKSKTVKTELFSPDYLENSTPKIKKEKA